MVMALVALLFGHPERLILLWVGVAAIMTMPETAINEYGNLLGGEDKIRMSLHGITSSPSGDPEFAENGDKLQFSGFVAFGTNAPHHGGALVFAENVCYGESPPPCGLETINNLLIANEE